jgi:hypothetical protein
MPAMKRIANAYTSMSTMRPDHERPQEDHDDSEHQHAEPDRVMEHRLTYAGFSPRWRAATPRAGRDDPPREAPCAVSVRIQAPQLVPLPDAHGDLVEHLARRFPPVSL